MAPRLSLSDIESLCLEIVPGTGAVQIEPLSSGLLSATYRVVRGGHTFSLRAAHLQALNLDLDSGWQRQVLATAARAALAPPLLHSDLRRGVLLMDWVPGRSWSAGETGELENIRKMAVLLRRIHALKLPLAAPGFTPMAWVALYQGALSRGARPRDTRLRSLAALHAGELERLPAVEASLCHSDLHRMNLLEHQGSLLLLDWEYAHMSDPLWDVAGWIANNDFEYQAKQQFLESYCGGVPTPQQRTRLEHLHWLYDYVCLLWSEVYLSLLDDLDGAVSARATVLDARLHLAANYAV